MAMTGDQVVDAARKLYVDQLRAFVAELRKGGPGRAEAMVSVEMKDGAPPREFEGLVCIDYAQQAAAGIRFCEFEPPSALQFEPVAGKRAGMDIEIDALRWDNVFISYAPQIDLTKALKPWFAHWFDQGGARFREGAEFQEIIHRLILTPRYINVDFGSAPPSAFGGLMDILARAGVRSVRVGGREPVET